MIRNEESRRYDKHENSGYDLFIRSLPGIAHINGITNALCEVGFRS